MGKQLNRTEFIASGMEALSAQIELIQTMQEQILLAEGKWQREAGGFCKEINPCQ